MLHQLGRFAHEELCRWRILRHGWRLDIQPLFQDPLDGRVPGIVEEQGKGASFASAAALAAIAGAAAGGAAMLTRNLGLSHKAEELEKAQEKAGKNKAEA